MSDNNELIKQIKAFFEEETKRDKQVDEFSNDVINLAYQKLSTNIQELIQEEEDPIVLSELLKSFLDVTNMVKDKNTSKQQIMLKFFEQLNKYEQSRYY